MRPIVVIGSLNMDLVLRTHKAPAAGETLAADSFTTIPGGKGANQAVAAARLVADGSVHMIGRVGADVFGDQLLQNLSLEGINTENIRRLPATSTGVAVIVVEHSGENRILIVAGANALLHPEDIDAHSKAIHSAGLIVLQFEIPQPTIAHAIHTANTFNIPVLLNPAPAYPMMSELLAQVDTIVLNEVECSKLTGSPVGDPAGAATAGRQLLQGHTRLVVVTLGAKGAVAVTPDRAFHIPAFPVEAVDTTAAGDAFIGALAVSLTQGDDLDHGVLFAAAVGALTVTRIGAQTSIPTLEEVRAFIRKDKSVDILEV